MLYVSQKFSGKIKVTASKKLQLLKICVQKALLTPHNPVGYRATDIIGLSLYPSQTGLDIFLTKISFPSSIPSLMFSSISPPFCLARLGHILLCVRMYFSLPLKYVLVIPHIFFPVYKPHTVRLTPLLNTHSALCYLFYFIFVWLFIISCTASSFPSSSLVSIKGINLYINYQGKVWKKY